VCKIETVLSLLKIDLGISHTVRDVFLNALLVACQKEIEAKKITLDLSAVEDQILLSDFTAWRYRNRSADVALANNLQFRIRNRIVKGRAANG